MENLIKNFDDEFFVIDSDNLDYIKRRLYGFSFQNNEIIENEQLDENIELNDFGAYVFVDVKEENIVISQDFNGSYGLYFFKKDDYFAISNSFVKLVDHVKHNYELSLNKNYADAFLFSGLVLFAYGDTLVNEISVLPRDYIINIDKINNTITFDEIDYKEKSISIDSKKGIEVLDAWYNKWIDVIRFLKSKTNNISIDLSGGFDSRVIAALWLTANIDINKIKIQSSKDMKHKGDFKIASKIANEFNFKLNSGNVNLDDFKFDDIMIPLNNSFNIKLGLHKQMFFKPFVSKNPIYLITGNGGECIKGYPNQSPQEYLIRFQNRIATGDPSLIDSATKLLYSSWDKISNKYNIDKNSNELPEIHYREVRAVAHFGKATIESYFANRFMLNPLIDSDLRKLRLDSKNCEDTHLLIAIIFTRYCPKLLDFEFESGFKIDNIDENTIKYAQKLNIEYPYNKIEKKFISGPKIEKLEKYDYSQIYSKVSEINYFLKRIFYSKKFEMEFKKYFSNTAYNSIIEKMETTKFFPLNDVYAAIAIIKVVSCVEFSKHSDKIQKWLENFLESGEEISYKSKKINSDLNIYSTARIDIKNNGESCSLEILEISKNVNISYPEWFNNNQGQGIIIESPSGNLKMKIKCINDGKLKLLLRGPDIRDKNNKRFPVFIDFTNLKINGEQILHNNTLLWHDNYYEYEKAVENHEIITVEINWMPFNKFSIIPES